MEGWLGVAVPVSHRNRRRTGKRLVKLYLQNDIMTSSEISAEFKDIINLIVKHENVSRKNLTAAKYW